MNKYPQVIFGDKIGVGKKTTYNPTNETFFALDFPLKRKESTWDLFPKKIIIQPEKIFPYSPSFTNYSLPSPIARTDTPDFSQWGEKVNEIIKSPIEKVVLSRKTTFTFNTLINPIQVIDMLHQRQSNSHVFGILLDPNVAFVGATPELLFKRNGLHLKTEALAGTRLLGEEKELLQSNKDLEEFAYVKETLRERLSLISHPFTISNDVYIKKTIKVCHLHYPFSVNLRKPFSDFALIDHIHPTPAISGLPDNLALKAITSLEPFDRGLYCGAIGMSLQSNAEVYVGIRSAIVEKNKLHIFAGAGIVKDSSPEDEWKELENKISQFGLL